MINTPGTRGGPGSCDRTLAVKRRKKARKSAFFVFFVVVEYISYHIIFFILIKLVYLRVEIFIDKSYDKFDLLQGSTLISIEKNQKRSCDDDFLIFTGCGEILKKNLRIFFIFSSSQIYPPKRLGN